MDNRLRPNLRRRAYLALALMAGLLLVAEELDVLPVDYDLPGVPDVELTYPELVVVVVALLLAAGFVYASALLYLSAPSRVGLRRSGFCVEYAPWGWGLNSRGHPTTPPATVSWDEISRIGAEGELRSSRHDLTILPKKGPPWVISGLAPDVKEALLGAFEAHVKVAERGSWRGLTPRPMPGKVRLP